MTIQQLVLSTLPNVQALYYGLEMNDKTVYYAKTAQDMVTLHVEQDAITFIQSFPIEMLSLNWVEKILRRMERVPLDVSESDLVPLPKGKIEYEQITLF